MSARTSRLLPWVLAGSVGAVAAGVAYVRHRQVQAPAPPAPPSSWAGPSAPENLLPLPAIQECLDRLPRSPEPKTLPDFAGASGELRVTWQLRPGPAPPDRLGQVAPSTVLRLRFEANGVERTLTFGAPGGAPYAADLSFCRDAPRGGPCGDNQPSRPVRGVVSEFSLQRWEGYLSQGATRWMIVRTASSLLLLKATDLDDWHEDDRGLCKDNVWRPLLEVPLGRTVVVREEVLVGDPPTPFDCVESYQLDARCAG